MIRILHVVDALDVGGVQNGLANVVERLNSQQFSHTVCAVRHLGVTADRLRKSGVQLSCLNKKNGGIPIQVGALAREIAAIRPDIVHSRNWGTIEAVFAGRWVGGCALVHSEHGLDVDTAHSEPTRRSWLRRVAFELADHVFCVSGELQSLFAARTGFLKNKIAVIRNGVNMDRFHPDSHARLRIRRELGIDEKTFCVGCVGRLDLVKDHFTLLTAMEMFEESDPNWKLLIVGDGPMLAPLKDSVIQRPKLRGKVTFLGTTGRVPEILNVLDAYVLMSVAEGISNSLLEAMATGVAVVASAVGGTPEVVLDNESGLLFAVGDARQLTERLLLLSRDQKLKVTLGAKAIERAKSAFSIDSMIARYEEMYARLSGLQRIRSGSTTLASQVFGPFPARRKS